MAKIIYGFRSYCEKHSICEFLSWKYFYVDCYLLNEEVRITVELNSKCPSKNNVYTGNMWGYSWQPLVFERNVLYA